jgi:geranylgeranyl pyrophosphate synthase
MSNASEVLVRKADSFGRALGIAFQIQDDILDLVGDTRNVGKTLGLDIEKVKLTLPVIHFLRTAPREHRQLLRSLLQSREVDKVEKIRNLILPSASIQYARDRARQYVDKALEVLENLPPSEARQVLATMAEFVITRPM